MNIVKSIFNIILTSAIVIGCDGSLSSGYSVGPGIDPDAPGNWLQLSEGGQSKIAMDTIIINHDYVGDYLVGVGMPAKVGSYICYDSSGVAKGEGGIIYRVKDKLDYFKFNLVTRSEEHYTSFSELYKALDKASFKTNNFNDAFIGNIRAELLSNSRINRSTPTGCTTYF